MAEVVFNRCSVGNDTKDGKIRPDSKEYHVEFNYEFLEDFRDKKAGFFSRLSHKVWKGYANLYLQKFRTTLSVSLSVMLVSRGVNQEILRKDLRKFTGNLEMCCPT